MGRPTDLDLSDFEAFLRDSTEYESGTRRLMAPGVRWIFRHFGGEWPPSGEAVRAKLRTPELASSTESIYARAWNTYMDFWQMQGVEVAHLRVPRTSRRNVDKTMDPKALSALRSLVNACAGFSYQKATHVKWGDVTFHRDYIRVTGHGPLIAFDPSHIDDICEIARWGFGLPDEVAEEHIIARIQGAPERPFLSRVRGGSQPVQIETLRRWLAKYG